MEDGDDYLRLDEADGCIVWNRFALAPETRAEPPEGFGAAAPASPMAELGDYELMWAFSGSTVHMPPEHPFRSPSYQSQAIRAPRPTPIRELLSASDPSISFFTYGAPPSAVPGVKLGMPQRDRAEKTKDFLQTSPFYQHVIKPRLEAAAAEEAAAEEAERKRLEKTSTRKPGEEPWVRRGTLEIAAEEVREDEAAARAKFRAERKATNEAEREKRRQEDADRQNERFRRARRTTLEKADEGLRKSYAPRGSLTKALEEKEAEAAEAAAKPLQREQSRPRAKAAPVARRNKEAKASEGQEPEAAEKKKAAAAAALF